MTERSWTPSDQSAFSSGRMTPRFCAVAVDAKDVAELARVDELLELLDAGVVEEEMSGHQHEIAVGGYAPRARRSRLQSSRAASRRARAFRPRAPAARGRRAWGRASPRPPRRARRPRAARRNRSSPAPAGSVGAFARALRRPRRRSTRARRGRRSSARGWGPSSRGPTHRDSQSFQTLSERRPVSPVAFRKSTTSWARSTTSS